MKWYNYKLQYINIEKCFGINVGINSKSICFLYDSDKFESIEYKTYDERDAEFAKIKILMGIEDFTSRCC
jgi:hypothetical protein